jgi:hypothetical protein
MPIRFVGGQALRFGGMRVVPAEDDFADFEHAQRRCQTGGAPRTGAFCGGCPRYLGRRRDVETGRWSVLCAWNDHDPVWALMTTSGALVTVGPSLSTRQAPPTCTRSAPTPRWAKRRRP